MRGTEFLRRIARLLTVGWALVLATAGSAVAFAQGAEARTGGDVYLQELARRASAGQTSAVNPHADAYLYELAERVGEQAPIAAGTDWTWILVAALTAVVVLAGTMLIVTARRHHWHWHRPVPHGRA